MYVVDSRGLRRCRRIQGGEEVAAATGPTPRLNLPIGRRIAGSKLAREEQRDKWKAKYGGLEVSDAKRLKALEDENAKLKKLLAEAMLDNAMLKDIAAKKW